MKVGATSTNFKAVKSAFESVYAGMGVSCSDIGGLWFEGANDYYEGMEPCDDAAATTQSTALPTDPKMPTLAPTYSEPPGSQEPSGSPGEGSSMNPTLSADNSDMVEDVCYLNFSPGSKIAGYKPVSQVCSLCFMLDFHDDAHE